MVKVARVTVGSLKNEVKAKSNQASSGFKFCCSGGSTAAQAELTDRKIYNPY
jgi:hypothetical protein